jgi:hypothetical protein
MNTSLMCPSIPRARVNRRIVHDHLFTLGYIEQEILREHWQTGTEKPERLVVGEEFPTILPRRYHPFANWRESDGRGRKPILKGWMGDLGIALSLDLPEPSQHANLRRFGRRTTIRADVLDLDGIEWVDLPLNV